MRKVLRPAKGDLFGALDLMVIPFLEKTLGIKVRIQNGIYVMIWYLGVSENRGFTYTCTSTTQFMAVLIGWWLVCGCRGALIFGRPWEDLVDLVNVEYYTKFCAMATCHYVTLWICRMFGPIAPTTGFYGRVLWTNYGGSRKQEKL